MEYWRSGYTFGWQAGYAAAEADQAELDRRAAESVKVAARGTDYATLCERRGEPDRAERQRRILIGRGIVPPVTCTSCGTTTAPWTCSCGSTRREVS